MRSRKLPGTIRASAVRNSDEAQMLKLPRTIRLDPSDTFVFERAAEPGEWAVSGAFVFWNRDLANLGQKQRVALRSGFLGIDSLGWSTLAIVTEVSEADREAMVERLAGQLLEKFGAPDVAAARLAAEEEVAFAASICDPPPQTLLAVQVRSANASAPSSRAKQQGAPIRCTRMLAPLPFTRSKATPSLPRRSIFSD
jgi:hypothetical protein